MSAVVAIVAASLAALPSEVQCEIAVDPEVEVIVLRTSLPDLLTCGLPGVRECVEDSLRSWCAAQTDARDVLRTLTRYDRRLGVWLACQVARTVLHLVPEGEHRPRIAIETAERWVRGEATAEECRRAADAAAAAYAAYAADAAARAAYAAARAAYADDAADDAAWTATRTRRLRELCGTIAEAIHGALDVIVG